MHHSQREDCARSGEDRERNCGFPLFRLHYLRRLLETRLGQHSPDDPLAVQGKRVVCTGVVLHIQHKIYTGTGLHAVKKIAKTFHWLKFLSFRLRSPRLQPHVTRGASEVYFPLGRFEEKVRP